MEDSKKRWGVCARRAWTRTGSVGEYVWFGLGFAALGLIVYAPVLDGAFLADDNHYIWANPYVVELSLANVLSYFDPSSVVTVSIQNYAPVHLFGHALEWQVFGEDTRGYHVVNVLLHALACLLLARCFVRTGIGRNPALIGAAIFLVHPANVEAVAWISQLKSSLSLVLTLLAVLLHPRRPAVAAVCFVLALMAKPFAAVAMVVVPIAGLLAQRRNRFAASAGRPSPLESWRWSFLALWLVAVLAFAWAESSTFAQSVGQAPPLYPDWGLRVRMVFYAAFRYMLMAATGIGTSAYHEPEAIASFVAPELAIAYLILGALACRWIVVFRRGEPEAFWWSWAVVSFAPLCGIVPIPFPIADRYLYFILPGLIGGCLLALAEIRSRAVDRCPVVRSVSLSRIAMGIGIVIGIVFAVQANLRAPVYSTPRRMSSDARVNYPGGVIANTMRAREAAVVGNARGAVDALAAARVRGYAQLEELLAPPFTAIAYDRRFVAIKREIARDLIARIERRVEPIQVEMPTLAQAYMVLDDRRAALAALERGAAIDGPQSAYLRQAADQFRRTLEQED